MRCYLAIPGTLALLLACCGTLAVAQDKAKGDEKKSPAVSIKNMQFAPATLKVKVGDKVTWTNNDDRDHTVVSDDNGKTFKSDNIPAKGTFSYTFTKKGTFSYACSYHPRMKGTVIVE